MSRPPHKSSWEERTHDRRRAFQILYSLSFTGSKSLADVKKAYFAFPEISQTAESEIDPTGFAWDLIQGVRDNEKALDDAIDKYSHNWRIKRMGRVELLLLRMAFFEITHLCTPGKVVIAEYLALADSFGAESAKSFMNGIMDAASKENRKFPE